MLVFFPDKHLFRSASWTLLQIESISGIELWKVYRPSEQLQLIRHIRECLYHPISRDFFQFPLNYSLELLKQSREFSLPPFVTGCLCMFKSPPQYRNGTMKTTIYYGVGLTRRQDSNRGRGDSAARALAAKATLYQMGKYLDQNMCLPKKKMILIQWWLFLKQIQIFDSFEK